MRVRSSPRCSMKDIRSSTLRAIGLPARNEVAQGADAAPRLESLTDRRRDVGLRLADRVAERLPARESGRDRRREGAAGAVGARVVEARRGEARRSEEQPSELQSPMY